MNISTLQPGEGIMRYKSLYALKTESDELEAWISREIGKSDRVTDLAKDILDGGGAALAKSTSPDDLAAARADVAAIRFEYGDKFGDEFLKSILPKWRLASIMRKYTKRSIEIAEDEKRSRRLNDLWDTTPATGPWSIH